MMVIVIVLIPKMKALLNALWFQLKQH